MIGASSTVFPKTLLGDILAASALTGSKIVPLSVMESRIGHREAFALGMIRNNDCQPEYGLGSTGARQFARPSLW